MPGVFDKPRTFDNRYNRKSDAQCYPRYEEPYFNTIEGYYWRTYAGKQEGMPAPISRRMLWMMGRAGKKNSNNREFQF